MRDYPFTGERDTVVAEHVKADEFASLRVTQPVDSVFRVFERHGTVCRSVRAPNRGKMELQVIIVEDDNRGNWGETFVWTIE